MINVINNWVNVIDPTPHEILELSTKYTIPAQWIENALEPNQLPLWIQEGELQYIVSRFYDVNASPIDTSTHQISRKCILILTDRVLLSIQRQPLKALQDLVSLEQASLSTPTQLVSKILKACILSYQAPLQKLSLELEKLENPRQRNLFKLSKANSIRKKSNTIARILHQTELLLTEDETTLNPLLNLSQRLSYQALEIAETVNTTLNHYTNLQAKQANDRMLLLTVISIVFLPLNFIAGFFGMNFTHLPLLNHPYGPIGITLLLLTVAISTLLLLKRKKSN